MTKEAFCRDKNDTCGSSHPQYFSSHNHQPVHWLHLFLQRPLLFLNPCQPPKQLCVLVTRVRNRWTQTVAAGIGRGWRLKQAGLKALAYFFVTVLVNNTAHLNIKLINKCSFPLHLHSKINQKSMVGVFVESSFSTVLRIPGAWFAATVRS